MECSLCGYLSPSLPLHVSHIRLVHGADKNFSLVCGIEGCNHKFKTFFSFNTHVYRKHRQPMGLASASSMDVDVSCDDIPTTEECFQDSECSTDTTSFPGVLRTSHAQSFVTTKQSSAEFLLHLTESCHLSQGAVKNVMNGCQQFNM